MCIQKFLEYSYVAIIDYLSASQDQLYLEVKNAVCLPVDGLVSPKSLRADIVAE